MVQYSGDSVQSYSEQIRRFAPSLFVATIAGLGIFSGVYTFSGLGLLIDNTVLAIILACVIQLTIASTVIGLPFVSGPPKLILFAFYFCFLMISSVTAYVYIFNQQNDSGRPEGDRIPIIQLVSTYVSELGKEELSLLEKQRREFAQAQANLREEESFGMQSGRGPGKGVEYSSKLLSLEEKRADLEGAERQYERFSSLSREIIDSLSEEDSQESINRLPFRLDELASLAHSSADEKRKEIASFLGDRRSPVEKALDPLFEGEWGSISVLSSIVWSVLFDTASLLMGLLWLNMQRSSRGVIDVAYETVRDLFLGFQRFKKLPEEVRELGDSNRKLLSENAAGKESLERFGARVIAQCSAVMDGTDVDPLSPVKSILRHLRVLGSSGRPFGVDGKPPVGIRASEVDEDQFLNSILAIMVLDDVFYVQPGSGDYVLNRDKEIAFDMLVFLVNNPRFIRSREIARYFPKYSLAPLLTDGGEISR